MNDVHHEFEETVKRIQYHNGVDGVIVVNNNGVYSLAMSKCLIIVVIIVITGLLTY